MDKPDIGNEGGVTVIRPGPDYDSINEDALPQFDDILELAKSIQPPLMVFDLSHTKYCGSAFLGLLVRVSNRLSVQRNGRFGVCNLSKFCHEVITAGRLNQLFDLFESCEDAIKAFNSDSEE